jgi:hypothetical protein
MHEGVDSGTLASLAKQVFAQRSTDRLKLLWEILEAYKDEGGRLTPERILLVRESLAFAGLAADDATALDTGPDVVLTTPHRFSTVEALRGEAELFGMAHRAALLVLYLLSGGAKGVGAVPFATCIDIAELLAAPSRRLSALPHWSSFAAECAVVDACLNRERPQARPSLHELQKAVRALLCAKQGHMEDAEGVAFFLSFGATKVRRKRLTKHLLLDCLVPRDVLRVGGLRRMNRPFQDCAVTIMLCLKRLGLNRDVAFLVVQWTIRREANPFRVVLTESDVDLSDEKVFDAVAVQLRAMLFPDKVVTVAQFAAFAQMTGWRRHIGADWAFDLVRTLRMRSAYQRVLRAAETEGKRQLHASFFLSHMMDDLPAQEYCVVWLPGGKCALQLSGTTRIGPAYSTLFRAVSNGWHRFNRTYGFCVSLKEGAGMTVGKIKVRELLQDDTIKFRISSADRKRICFVVKEGPRFFLAPSIEREGQPYAFRTMRELVKHYEAELAWLQSDTEEMPPECAWLHSLFD